MAFDVEGARKAGYSDGDIADYLAAKKEFNIAGARKAGYDNSEIITHLLGAKKEPESRNIGAVLNDTVIAIANSSAGLAKAATDFVAPGNKFSKAVDEFIKQGEASQSDIVKAGRNKFNKDMKEANTIGEEVSAVGKYVFENPLQAAGQAVGSFAGPGIAIKGATKAAQLLGATEKVAGRVGLGAGVVTNAMMSGGDAAGSAYDMVMQTPDKILMENDFIRSEVEKGRSLEEVKKEAATTAARRASAIPALIGGVSGGFGVEKILAGAAKPSASRLANALKTGTVEALQEAAEEGATEYSARSAAKEYDPRIDPTKGVAGAAAFGAILGGAPGAAIGAMQRPSGATDQAEPTPAAPTPTAPTPAAPTATAQPQAQPQANPQRDALVQSYIQQGMAPDDAALVADRDFAALTTSPEATVQPVADAAKAVEAANVTTPESAVASAQPTTDQSGAGVPSAPTDTAAGATNPFARGLAGAERVVTESTGGKRLPRTPVDALTAEIPTYEGAQKVLNEFKLPEKYMIMEVEHGFVIVPRPAQAAAPVSNRVQDITDDLIGAGVSPAEAKQRAVEIAKQEAENDALAELAAQALTEERRLEKEAELAQQDVTPTATEVIEETPSGTETIEAEQTETQGQETPATDESAPAVNAEEEAKADAETKATGTEVEKSIAESKDTQKKIKKEPSNSNATATLRNQTLEQIKLADKLILTISDFKQIINSVEKEYDRALLAGGAGRVDASARAPNDARYNETKRQLASLLNYFRDLSTQGKSKAHTAAKDYIDMIDNAERRDAHIESIKQRAAESRKNRVVTDEDINIAVAKDEGKRIRRKKDEPSKETTAEEKYNEPTIAEVEAELETLKDVAESKKQALIKAEEEVRAAIKEYQSKPHMSDDRSSPEYYKLSVANNEVSAANDAYKAAVRAVDKQYEKLRIARQEAQKPDDIFAEKSGSQELAEFRSPKEKTTEEKFESRLPLNDAQKAVLVKQYGEKSYGLATENRFIEDINEFLDKTNTPPKNVLDIILAISPDTSRQVSEKINDELKARTEKLLADYKAGKTPLAQRRNYPNPAFNKAKSVTSALEIIANDKKNNTGFDRLLAEYLLSPQNIGSIKDVSFNVVETNDKKLLKEAGRVFKDARGLYKLSAGGRDIYVKGESFSVEEQGVNTVTVLHEALHGAGNEKINLVLLARKYGFTKNVSPALVEAVNGLERLMERAGNIYQTGKRDAALQFNLDNAERGGAFEDVKEFYTYAMTMPSMQEFLRTEVPGELKAGTKKSGFSAFVDTVLAMFGIDPKIRSGVIDLFVHSDVIIQERISKQTREEVAIALAADKAKLYSQAKKQKSSSQDAERKLDAAKRQTQIIEDMGSLMNVAKNPALWPDYIRLNFRNIATPAYKGLLAALPTNVILDTGTALGIGGLTDVNANVQKMHTYRTQELQKVQDTAAPWIKLDPSMQTKLADTMHYATDVQIDPDITSGKDLELDNRWNALDNDAREVYRKVRDFYKNKYKLYRALLEQRVNDVTTDPAERKQLMDSIKATYGDKNMEPYFPFMRYGEYWASIGEGATKEFHMFESPGQRDLFLERRVKELNLKGDKRTLAEMMTDEDVRAGNDVNSLREDTANESANLKGMFATIDGMKTSSATEKSRLKDEIFQMHLLTLPEASFRKQFIHRKGTAGFSGDALRNFIEASSRITNQLSRVKYGPKINVAMSAANDSLAGNPDQAKLGMITREIELRLEEELAPEFKDGALDKVARTANKAAFIWLLTSVKSAANQLFSVVSFTMPTLAKYHGWGATLKEMRRMSAVWNEVGATKTDKNGNVTFIPSVSIGHSKAVRLNPIEQRAYQVMVDRGVADATRTYDLFMDKGNPSADRNSTLGNVVKAMGTLFHATERLSREISYMAAFRLEMKKHGDFDRATEAALHVVNEALFDYSTWNAPRAIRSPGARVATQFMKFPLFTSIYLARNFRIMMKPMDGETRAGAFKAFSGTLLMTTLVAGTAGLPMYSAVMGIIQALRNAMRDDDEEIYMEEDNLELWFRKVWLHETFGDIKIAGHGLDEIIDTGLLDNITGFKFSDGLSLNNMWTKDAPEASSWKDAYAQTATSFLGPAYGLGESWATAIDDINKGDMLKGLEKLSPALTRGIIADIRYKKEGAVSPIGDTIKYSDEFTYAQLLMQAMGYKTVGLAERMNELYLVNQERKKVEGKRQQLISALNRAAVMERDADFDAVDEEIDNFNMKYPQTDLRIDYEDKERALEKRREMLRKSDRGYASDKRFRDLDELQERSLEKIEREAR
jgi:hypothetical protein